MVLVHVSKRWILRFWQSTDREYVLTGTVSMCRIHVDLHTRAVSIVSKKQLRLKSVKGSEVQYVRSFLGRGDRLEDSSL